MWSSPSAAITLAFALTGCANGIVTSDVDGSAPPPQNDAAGLDAPPPGNDAALPSCNGYVSPAVAATCTACMTGGHTCQPNGCYNGYFCDPVASKCHPPPAGC